MSFIQLYSFDFIILNNQSNDIINDGFNRLRKYPEIMIYLCKKFIEINFRVSLFIIDFKYLQSVLWRQWGQLCKIEKVPLLTIAFVNSFIDLMTAFNYIAIPYLKTRNKKIK